MSQSVTATINSTTQARFQSSQAFSTTFTGTPFLAWQRQFTTSETTKCYFGNFTVTTSPTSIDLTGLTDAYGSALSFATIRHLQITNNDETNSLTVGGGTNGLFTTLPFSLVGYSASNGTSDGSCLQLTTNLTVDGTHKILTLTAGAGSISVDVFLLGA